MALHVTNVRRMSKVASQWVVTVLVAPPSVNVVVSFGRYFVLAFCCIVEWYV